MAIAPDSARGLVDLLAALVLQRTGLSRRVAGPLQPSPAPAAARRRRRQHVAIAHQSGTLLAYQGAFDAARADLVEAERLATALELWVLVAMAAHNQGFTEGRRGQVPVALAAFDRAEVAYAAAG